jgi:hypothetical protein
MAKITTPHSFPENPKTTQKQNFKKQQKNVYQKPKTKKKKKYKKQKKNVDQKHKTIKKKINFNNCTYLPS